MLTHDQIEDLLDYMGVTGVKQWKGDKIQFCCPVHGESHPSCGINADYSPEGKPNEHYQVAHCFSCGFSGTIPWLLFKAMPEQFKSLGEAVKFIKSRYGVSFIYNDNSGDICLTRYEDLMPALEKSVKRFELPKSELAPFKSGKSTYTYFLKRGFDLDDVKEYMIGMDTVNKTVTVPIFWEDGKLAGIIGRYIDPNRPKNMRFKIYDFPKSGIVYPLDKLEVINDTIIGVESLFDCIMLRKWGYTNAIAFMGDGVSKSQADLIAKRCSKFIPLFDLDNGGETALNILKKRLGNRVMILEPTYLPKSGKDPIEWGELETVKRINSAKIGSIGSLPRF